MLFLPCIGQKYTRGNIIQRMTKGSQLYCTTAQEYYNYIISYNIQIYNYILIGVGLNLLDLY